MATKGRQTVTLKTLAPANYTTAVVDEATDPAFSSGFDPRELKKHIVIRSNDAKLFCNVIGLDDVPAALAGNRLTVGRFVIRFGDDISVKNN